jgi:putative transposase
MATHLRTDLVLDALNMAVAQRRPWSVIHHSDQGCQYTSIAFGLRCRQAGVRPSMGSVGDCFDNAMCESFFATLECELLDRRSFRTQVEARLGIFDFIEGWCNPRRRHSALGQISPCEFERRHAHVWHESREKVAERRILGWAGGRVSQESPVIRALAASRRTTTAGGGS